MKIALQKIKYLGLSAVHGTILFLTQFSAVRAQSTLLQNPLNSEITSIPSFIAMSLKVVVMIALPVIVLFFVIAGFKFISAQGNPSKLGEARTNFMWVTVGALLVLGAWVLATLIAGTVSQLVGP